jgi:hypothetical protein
MSAKRLGKSKGVSHSRSRSGPVVARRPTAKGKRVVEAKTNRPNSQANGDVNDDLGSGNIEKVRDILFGGQMRDYERRFVRLEERLLQETNEMKDDVRKRLSALEQFVKKEVESLADRIKTEHEERTDATKELAREARDSAKAFEKKTGALDDHIGKVQRETRQHLLELEKGAADDLKQKSDELLGRISQESTELRADKADRATLAALFTEMAMRLTNELSIPAVDNGRRK